MTVRADADQNYLINVLSLSTEQGRALTLTFARRCPIIDFIFARYPEGTSDGPYRRRL